MRFTCVFVAAALAVSSVSADDTTCLDLSSGIPFDLEDIVSRVMGDVDKSGLLGLLPGMIKGMGMDPLDLPINVDMQIPLFNMNVTRVRFGNVSISGWSAIKSLGGINTSHDDPNHLVVQPAIVLGNPGPIWLNASVAIEGELLPLELLDIDLNLAINLDSFSFGFDLDTCFDTSVFSFNGLVGLVIQMLSMDKSKQLPFLLKSLLKGIKKLDFAMLDIHPVMKEFFAFNVVNNKKMDIKIPANVQDMIDSAVEYLGNTIVREDINKILDQIFKQDNVDAFLSGVKSFGSKKIEITFVPPPAMEHMMEEYAMKAIMGGFKN